MSEFKKIEEKWQKKWAEAKVFESDPKEGVEKFFVTVPYPYVNGAPHMGHAYSFLRGDVYARFKRMQGFNVLLPQGFHATGEPILGVVERLRKKDQDQIDALRALGTDEREIKKFAKEGPEYVARYWMKKWIEVLKKAGYSADWRRTFITAMTPSYDRFIQWQYRTLKKKGYVVQGTHPVVWCPNDQSPTGDHDRLVGEGESPVEYTVIKFKLDSGEVLPCATMRPETVYGATNVWMNLDGDYVTAEVDGESWVVGRRALEKLADQLHKVEIKEKVDPADFVGKLAENPVTKTKVPVLPAKFVDSSVATGVVMSVPSHAPYDWAGLHDLKDDLQTIEKFGIDSSKLPTPIPVIRVEGMGESPAIEVAGSMLIESQSETDKLDEATSRVYKKEFHEGVMRDDTGYPGMKVSEAKEKVSADLAKKGDALRMWEITGEVMCRCKTRCHVKILENQWFLKFSDEKWKDVVKEAISRMSFRPELARSQFMNTVDWLKDKACARKSGLGTKLPWDDEWIVETLSDSVIYMAYYTVSHVIEREKIPADKLTDEVFDYVFLGEGTAEEVSKKSRIGAKVLDEMKREFDYYYPVDVRFSGKDLIQNHLTYFLFHHTAIWENSANWPRGIAVNGYVIHGGEKMSKSKGNVMRLRDLIEKYGADVTRLNLVGANENMDDADWREDNIEAFRSRIKMLQKTIRDLKTAKRRGTQGIDRYLLSRAQRIISQATEACESARFRFALQSAFFEATNDLKWYVERSGGLKKCNGKVLKQALSTYLGLLSPFMPHLAEEMWKDLGNRGLASVAKWPEPDKKLVDERSEMGEELVSRTIDDVNNIKKISGIEPKGVTVIVAPQWKFDVYDLVLKNRGKDFKEVLKMVREKNQDTVKYIQALQKRANELPEAVLGREEQFGLLGEAKVFLERQVSAKVKVEDAEKSKLPKAKNADVQKPAILLE